MENMDTGKRLALRQLINQDAEYNRRAMRQRESLVFGRPLNSEANTYGEPETVEPAALGGGTFGLRLSICCAAFVVYVLVMMRISGSIPEADDSLGRFVSRVDAAISKQVTLEFINGFVSSE